MSLQTVLAILSLMALCATAMAGLTYGGLAALYVAMACLPAYGLVFGIEYRNAVLAADRDEIGR